MSNFDDIDLSQVSAPDVVETLDFETILAEIKEDFVTRYPDYSADLESDPVAKLLETTAYRELVLRQRVNDGARAVMLAHATGADLDNLAALFHIARQVVDPGDPDATPAVEATYETDARLRTRAQLAMEAVTTAGSEGSYVFHALSADTRVLDVNVASPDPGEVVVTILDTENDGVADAELLSIVSAALNADDVRPLTDQVTVQAGTKTDYSVVASLDIYDGPDAEVVRTASVTSVTTFTEDQKLLGEPITIDGLHKALRVDGVRKVTLSTPAADIEPDADGFAHCTSITVTAS